MVYSLYNYNLLIHVYLCAETLSVLPLFLNHETQSSELNLSTFPWKQMQPMSYQIPRMNYTDILLIFFLIIVFANLHLEGWINVLDKHSLTLYYAKENVFESDVFKINVQFINHSKLTTLALNHFYGFCKLVIRWLFDW